MNQSILRKLASGHQTLGIEITDSSIKICEVQQRGKKAVRVLRFMTKPLEEGIVSDGNIVDRDRLKEALKATLGARKFGTRYAHFAIPSQMVMVRSLKLPDIAHKELKKLVQFEMKNNMSMAFDDPYYDFIKLKKILPDRDNANPESANLCEVLVVAASTEVLRDYANLLEEVKLIPSGIEIKSFSLMRMIEWGKIPSAGINVIVNVNELNSEFTIIENGTFKITRNIEISFKALAEQAGGEDNFLLNSFSSPEQAFQNATQDLIAELERLMNFYYYNLNKGEGTFQRIFLSGDIEELDKLAAIMAEGLTPPVSLLEWNGLPVGRNSAIWSLGAYAVPLGLALRGKEA
jgi:type IV pilus assembly protein PilM